MLPLKTRLVDFGEYHRRQRHSKRLEVHASPESHTDIVSDNFEALKFEIFFMPVIYFNIIYAYYRFLLISKIITRYD